MRSNEEDPSSDSPITLPPMPEPDRFDGSNQPVEHFLLQLNLFFRTTGPSLSDTSKSLYLISRLKGQALDWAAPLLAGDHPSLQDYGRFTEVLSESFSDPDKTQNAKHQLTSLRQGSDTVRTYGSKFTHLARLLQWNEDVLVHLFFIGLNLQLQDELITKDRPSHLPDMIIMASRLEQRLLERFNHHKQEHLSSPLSNPTIFTTDPRPYPTNIGHSFSEPNPGIPQDLWSSLPEKQRRYLTRVAHKLCLFCGSPDHQVGNCPIKPPKEGKPKAQFQK